MTTAIILTAAWLILVVLIMCFLRGSRDLHDVMTNNEENDQ